MPTENERKLEEQSLALEQANEGLRKEIAERKRLEEERELSLNVLGAINSSTDLRTLMREVTGLLRDSTGCDAVGIRLRDGEDFPYHETTGFPAAFVKAENKLCATETKGRHQRDSQGNPVLECMCGNILRGRFDPTKPFFTARGSFWTNSTTKLLASTTEADRQARPRNRCHGEGYESVALIRLRTGGATFGLLQFNDKRTDRFTPEKIARLERIADHLAVALARWQQEEARQRSDERLRLAIEAAGFGIYDYDFASGTGDGSPEFKALFGLKPDQEILLDADKLPLCLHPEDRPAFLSAMTAANDPRGNGMLQLDYRILCPDGSVRWLQVRGLTFFGADGEARRPERATGVVLDITERMRADQELRLSRQRLALHVQQTPLAVIEFDLDGRLREWNPAAVAMFGFSRDEALGQHWRFIVPEAIWGSLEGVWKAIVSRTGGSRSTNENRTKDGRMICCEWFNTPLIDLQGKAIGVASLAMDITERRQMEERITELLKEQRAILEAAPIGIAFNKSRVLQWANRAYNAMFGYAPEEMGGLDTSLLYVHAEDYERVGREGFARIAQGLTYSVEVELKTKNRARFWCHLQGRAIDRRDLSAGVIWMLTDVTERKRAEEALRKSAEDLNRAQALAHVGSWSWDVQNDAVTWSAEVFRIYGVNPEAFEHTREAVARLIHPDDLARQVQAVEAVLRGRAYEPYEYRVLRPDGAIRTVHVFAAEVEQDAAGKPIRVVGAVQDITERKRAEEEMGVSREQLRALAARVQAVREEERTRVAREIHDVLAQHLTSVKIDAALLTRLLANASGEPEQGLVREKLAEMTAGVNATIGSVQRLATDLRPAVLDSLGLCAAIEWQAKDFQERTGIACEALVPAKDVPLDRDLSTALFRISQESLTNVVRHAAASRVEILLQCDAGYMTLTVRDNGRGLQPDQATAPGSVGLLGMRERALLLGGRCDITGRPGEGTTVKAQIPLSPKPSSEVKLS